MNIKPLFDKVIIKRLFDEKNRSNEFLFIPSMVSRDEGKPVGESSDSRTRIGEHTLSQRTYLSCSASESVGVNEFLFQTSGGNQDQSRGCKHVGMHVLMRALQHRSTR